MKKQWAAYLNFSFLLSLFIYIATCTALFLIDRAYAGTLGSGFLALAVMIPLVRMIGRTFRKENAPKENRKDWESGAAIVLFIAFLFDAYLIYSDRFFLDSYLLLAIIIVGLALYIIEWRYGRKFDEVHVLGIVYSALMLAAVLFWVVVSPRSVNKSEKMVADRGYTDISFLAGIRNKKPIMGNVPVLSAGNKKGLYTFYHFEGKKDGERYIVYIDAISGVVIGEVRINDNGIGV